MRLYLRLTKKKIYRRAYKSSIFYIQHDALYIDSIKKTYTFFDKSAAYWKK